MDCLYLFLFDLRFSVAPYFKFEMDSKSVEINFEQYRFMQGDLLITLISWVEEPFPILFSEVMLQIGNFLNKSTQLLVKSIV